MSKPNEVYKNVFIKLRKEAGLSRADADEILEGITAERLERIENEKMLPAPEDINAMVKGYNAPSLWNYYCSNCCQIGRERRIKQLDDKDLFQIVIETLSTLNTINDERNRLVDIVSDGKIDDSEMERFLNIKKQLEAMSQTVESLNLWFAQQFPNCK